jgi:peptidyl-prolyl cis-trans isomerase SurA
MNQLGLLAKPFLIFLVLLLSPYVAAAQENSAGSTSGGEELVDQIVAVVNGQVITLYDLNLRLKPVLDQYQGRDMSPEEKQRLQSMRRQVMEQMIADMLITGEAARLGVQVSDAELDGEVAKYKENNGLTDEQLDQQLTIQGLTLGEFKEKMRKDIVKHRLLSYMVRNKVLVTDEEIEKAYESESVGSDEGRTIHLALILFPPAMSGAEVRKNIEDGKMTFAEAAKRYSQGPGADNGGDLGDLSWSDLAQAWRDELEDLEPGQMSQLFDVNGQEALLLVVNFKQGAKVPLAEVRDKIYEELYNEKLDVLFREYLEKLRGKAVIEIKD